MGGVLPAGIKGDSRQGGGLDYGQELSQNRRPHTANIVRSEGQGGSGNGEVRDMRHS